MQDSNITSWYAEFTYVNPRIHKIKLFVYSFCISLMTENKYRYMYVVYTSLTHF